MESVSHILEYTNGEMLYIEPEDDGFWTVYKKVGLNWEIDGTEFDNVIEQMIKDAPFAYKSIKGA